MRIYSFEIEVQIETGEIVIGGLDTSRRRLSCSVSCRNIRKNCSLRLLDEI
jgi:hypothetical protein